MLRRRRRKLTFIDLHLTIDVQCHLEVLERVKDDIGYVELLSAERRCKYCAITQRDALPDAGRRFHVYTGRDLREISPHTVCLSSLDVREDGSSDSVSRSLEARQEALDQHD